MSRIGKTKVRKSYQALLGPVVYVEIVVFRDIASQFRGFFELTQTDKPMAPFLEEALSNIALTSMR